MTTSSPSSPAFPASARRSSSSRRRWFLLDEFARGTNPDEGALIVQAVTRYLNDVNAISLLTTHYDKVAEFARTHYQIIGLRDIDPEAIRRELAVTSEDGVTRFTFTLTLA